MTLCDVTKVSYPNEKLVLFGNYW